MQKKNKIARCFKFIYHQVFRINDSPQKISLGFGLGVFLGILPGTGPIASLVLAAFFRINRASALLGNILTNTWLSFVTLLISVKIGSFILGIKWPVISTGWEKLITDFSWKSLIKISSLQIIFPVILGYLVTGLIAGVSAYLSVILALSISRQRRKR